MRLEIVTIGDELLLGFTVDTNAAHIARTLAAIGVEVVRRSTVGDQATEIAAAVSAALDRTGAVITTGGLGPTSDDLTKPAVAALFGREMVFDEAVYEKITALFRSRGYAMPLPDSNRQQAFVPSGATLLANNHGTAPGIWLENDAGQWVAMLPGVPREMRGMLAEEVLPRLSAGPDKGRVLRSLTVRTTGIAESALADRLQGLALPTELRPLAYLPGIAGVDCRLTVLADSVARASAVLDAAGRSLADRIGEFAYGTNDEDLAAIVVDACRARGLRIATAESCTGGLLSGRITAVPGSSDVYTGGIVAYDDRVKSRLLDVPEAMIRQEGAVSESVVRAMATGARRALGTAIGIGITGVAGPGGGSEQKPVGTVWMAADVDGVVDARMRRFPGDREEIRLRAAQLALDLVRRLLKEAR